MTVILPEARPRIKRPLLRYHGGKYRLRDWIIQFFSAHRVYVEPFGGAASVLMHKDPSIVEVYNDLDETVWNFMNVLRNPETSEMLRRSIVLTPFSRREFIECWEVGDTPVEEARRLVVRSFQAIGNKDRLKRNGWRTRTAKSDTSPTIAWNDWPDWVPAFHARLRTVVLECLTWEAIIDLYDHPDALFYFDPPYVTGTRSRDHGKVYAHEMTDEDHRRLLARLVTMKSKVILSGYATEMYDEALPGWSRYEKAARAQTNSARTEVVWLNPAAAGGYQPGFLEGL